MRTHTKRWVWMGAVVVLGVFAMVNCGKDAAGPITGNRPPETSVFLPQDPDTSLYIQTLSWWGEDSDGEVTHYLFRFLCDSGPSYSGDTAWVTTTLTESTFYLPVSDGVALHVFEVKAVDDAGAEDPTPASVNLLLRNSPPHVYFDESILRDVTLPAMTFAWTAYDSVDGSDTISEFRIWLDGADTVYSLPGWASDHTFGKDDLLDTVDRDRTVYLQAVDSGSDTSATVSYTWHVRQPIGRILLVDDVDVSVPGGTLISDPFYRDVLDSLASGGELYSVYDFETDRGFSHQNYISATLELFDVVLWYTGLENDNSQFWLYLESGTREYLDRGGSLVLVSMSALGFESAITEEFTNEYLGIKKVFIEDPIYLYTDFQVLPTYPIIPAAGSGLDTLRTIRPLTKVEMFSVHDDAIQLYRIPLGVYPGWGQDETWSIGVRKDLPGGGSSICVSFAWEFCDGNGNGKAELAKIITDLLP